MDGRPKNVGIATAISQICYSYQKYFYFRSANAILFFSSNRCLFASGIHPLNQAPPKIYRNSHWNFTNILSLSEAISISGLQAPLFLTVIIIYLCQTYVLWIGLGAPENVGIATGISQIFYS